MKITKFVHSCLLVEMPAPVNRTALFDPGSMSADMLREHTFEYLDDIFITHIHPDHMDVETIEHLVGQFPDVRITTTPEIVQALKKAGIAASEQAPSGVAFFNSPHEVIQPYMPAEPPQEVGVHYLELLSHPGDSHSFTETMPVLALPVQAPWGSTVDGFALALKLKPKYVIPIHDWHWSEAARKDAYDRMEERFAEHEITFIKTTDGQPFVIYV